MTRKARIRSNLGYSRAPDAPWLSTCLTSHREQRQGRFIHALRNSLIINGRPVMSRDWMTMARLVLFEYQKMSDY